MSSRAGYRYPYRRYGSAYNNYSNWRRNYNRYTTRAQRRATANQRAAQQQRDSCNVNLNILHKASIYYRVVDNYQLGVYACNIYDLLRQSKFYNSYAEMYDQMKIDKIQVKCTPVQWSQANNTNSTYNNVTICTAWDRNGLDDKQYIKNGDNYFVIIGNDIGTYSSAYTKTLAPNSSYGSTRTLYPSTVAEKGQYIATSDLKQWYRNVNANSGAFQSNVDYENYAKSTNPCFLEKDNSVPFKPTFLMGVIGGIGDFANQMGEDPFNNANVTLANISKENFNLFESDTVVAPIIFNLEFDIACTFRGLRKAPIVDTTVITQNLRDENAELRQQIIALRAQIENNGN